MTKRHRTKTVLARVLGLGILLAAVAAVLSPCGQEAVAKEPELSFCTRELEAPARMGTEETENSIRVMKLPRQEPDPGQPETSDALPPGEMPEKAVSAPEAAPEPDALPEPVEDTYFSDAVFLGDSRTEGFSLYSGLKEGQYLFAVGATVESVFTKPVWQSKAGKVPLLDALAGMECSKIYLMLGVNELGWVSSQTFRDQYAKMVDRIREDHPEAVVVIQSILPVGQVQEDKKTYVNNARICEYNDLLEDLAREKECVYLDVASAVSDETGCLRADWTFDGVHLNTAGCKAWLAYLKEHPVD